MSRIEVAEEKEFIAGTFVIRLISHEIRCSIEKTTSDLVLLSNSTM